MGKLKDILKKYMGVPTDQENEDLTRKYEESILESKAGRDAERARELSALRREDAIMEAKRKEESLKRAEDKLAEEKYFQDEEERRAAAAESKIKQLQDEEKSKSIESQLKEKGYYKKEEPEVDPLRGPNSAEYEKMMKKKLGYY